MAAANRPAEPSPGDAASPATERAVQEVRRDAVAFSEAEEAFFRGVDTSLPVALTTQPVDSFADIDEGYDRPKFWDRGFGRKRKRAASEAGVVRRPPTEK
jgi:hypothetical protein